MCSGTMGAIEDEGERPFNDDEETAHLWRRPSCLLQACKRGVGPLKHLETSLDALCLLTLERQECGRASEQGGEQEVSSYTLLY